MIIHREARTLADFLQTGGLGWLTREIYNRGVDQDLLDTLSTRYPGLTGPALNGAVDRAVRNAGIAARIASSSPDADLARGAHVVNPTINKEYYYIARTTGNWVDRSGAVHSYVIDFGVNSDTPLSLNQIENEVSARLSDTINPLSGTQGVGSITGTPTMELYRAERRT